MTLYLQLFLTLGTLVSLVAFGFALLWLITSVPAVSEFGVDDDSDVSGWLQLLDLIALFQNYLNQLQTIGATGN